MSWFHVFGTTTDYARILELCYAHAAEYGRPIDFQSDGGAWTRDWVWVGAWDVVSDAMVACVAFREIDAPEYAWDCASDGAPVAVAYADYLYVARHYRGVGLAADLVAFTEGVIASCGFDKVVLNALPHLGPMYEKRGYVNAGRWVKNLPADLRAV